MCVLGPGIDNYNVRSLRGKVELSVECVGKSMCLSDFLSTPSVSQSVLTS